MKKQAQNEARFKSLIKGDHIEVSTPDAILLQKYIIEESEHDLDDFRMNRDTKSKLLTVWMA